MTNYKLRALFVAVVLVTAAASGGGSLAILSDRATVTTTIAVGNSPTGSSITVTGETSESVASAANAPTSLQVESADKATPLVSSGGGDAAASDGIGDQAGQQSSGMSMMNGDLTIALNRAAPSTVKGSIETDEVILTTATGGIGTSAMTFDLSNHSVAYFLNTGPRLATRSVRRI